MNTFLWSCAALLAVFVTAEGLSCNICDVKIFGRCIKMAPVHCSKTQDRCYTAVARFNSSMLDIHAKGCAELAECKNETGSILYVNYTITRECCNTNLCNGAAPAQLQLTAALGSVLMLVWSQMGL